MRKTLKKALTIALTLTMIFSSLILLKPVSAEDDPATYTIYPTPQEVVYGNGDFKPTDEINLVYGEMIDSDTKNHVVDVLDILNKSNTVTNAIDQNKTNLIVGVYNSGDYVDTYFKDNAMIDSEDLFTKFDSYILSIDNGVIAVLGKDTDAAFHGVTTIKHIFNQVKDNNILNLKINDYAEIKSRGFIEGYYGSPWSKDDRIDLMTFGGDYKLNQYIYAPKDDPKHRTAWKQMYNDEELQKIAEEAEAGNKSKCYFVYALHPFVDGSKMRFDTEANYQTDLNIIKTKFEQLMSVGVKQFSILADDAGEPTGGAASYIKVMTDLTNWLTEKQATYEGLRVEMTFCPANYHGDGTGVTSLKGMPDTVSIIQTGGQVWGSTNATFLNNFNNSMGTSPFMWINWPCSDNTKDGLIMGGATRFLIPGADPEKMRGIVLNPMQQSEPSKAGIFTNADYAWNIWQDASEYDKVWYDSFNYMDHGTIEDTESSIALREISKHMMNSNTGIPESVELAPKLTQFLNDFNSGNDIKAQAEDLKIEFKKLQDAAAYYKENPGNERTRDQIIYWLDCWEDTTTAIDYYLDAAVAIQDEKDNNVIWDLFAAGQTASEKSKTHAFKYLEGTQYAKVGRGKITPFMNQLDSILSTKVGSIIDPNKQFISVITSRGDTPAEPTSKMLDGDETTYAQWKTPNSSVEGEYVGITYSKAINLNEVKFLMSNSASTNKNTFKSAKLQYTEDGKEWKDIDGTIFENKAYEVSASGLDLMVKGIRVVCTEATPDIWLAIREIYVNGQSINGPQDGVYNPRIIKTTGYEVYSGSEDNLLDENDSSHVWYKNPGNTSKVGDFVGVDLGKVMPIEKVRFIMGYGESDDYWDAYDLEYSVNGNSYTKFNSYKQNTTSKVVEEDFEGVQARYIRVRNTNARDKWLKMAAFTVTPIFVSDTTVDTNVDSLKNIGTEIANSIASVNATDNITLNTDEYIGIILPRIRDLANIDLELTNGSGLTLQVSKNYIDWQDVDPTTSDLPDARYVRIINKTAESITFGITKFEVNSKEVSGPYLLDSDIGINSSWGVAEDSRNNGAAFDGNVNTPTEFADLPQKGQYIIYDLGQERTINKIEMYCQDTAVNYIRDADILISDDLNNWTKVVTIGDGIENIADGNIACMNSDAGYVASNKYPNKVFVEGTVDNVKARYLKILITATNKNRAVVFNEIVINDGEYVPVSNDPTFNASVIEKQGYVPQNMFDGDLSTDYRPDTTEAGYITYTLSENLDVKKINIIQKGNISNAKVSALVDTENGREWVEVGSLSRSLNEIYLPFWENIYELKFEWEANSVPVISEIVMMNDDSLLPNRDELQTYIDDLNIEEDKYTPESYQEFADKLDDAVKVLSNNNSNQKQLDEALTALQDAVSNLELKETPDTDKLALQITVDRAIALEEEGALENVIPIVVEEFHVALAEAKEILADPNALQTTIDASFNRLSRVIQMLEFYIGDKTALQITVDTAIVLEEQGALDNVIPIVVEEFHAALAEAKEILADPNALQITIDTSFYRLSKAIQMLEFIKGDKSELEALIKSCEKYDEENYTAESWAVLQEALAAANKVMEDENALEYEVVDAVNNLKDAIGQLVLKADKTRLQAMYDKVEGLDKSKYTSASVAKLTEPMAKAKEVLENTNATQEEINKAYEELVKAYLELRLIPDKSILEELINEANGLNRANYTAATWQAVEKELENANKVMNDPEATEAEVNSAQERLTKALAGLVENSNTPVDTNTNKAGNSVKPGDPTKATKTGDNALVGVFTGLAMLSIAGLKILRKKEEC